MEYRYNREIRENTEMNKKARLMELMRKVPDRPGDLREWFFEKSAGEDYMFRKKGTRLSARTAERAAKHLKSRDRMVEKESGTMTW